MTRSEEHLNTYKVMVNKLEQLMKAFDILSTVHLPITLISPTQLTHMLEEVKTALQKTENKLHSVS